MTTLPILEGAAARRWIADRAGIETDSEARAAVEPIIAAVRERGDAALREYTLKFDKVEAASLAVGREQLREALVSISSEQRRALEQARQNIERFHRAQMRQEDCVEVAPGVSVWREFRPLERVGIYVPGGRASYPSTVLMCGVPARLAGCSEIVICAPPGPDGQSPTAVLAAAELLGIERVFAVGGAQAIAALAFGTESVPRVDKIFGPGNRYVTAAKELVYGTVNIDMPAGPSEVVVLADQTARAAWVAADLLSQAEHAPDTLAVCITTGREAAERIAAAVEAQLASLPAPAAVAESLSRSAICVAEDLDTGVGWVDELAAEHLTIMTEDDRATLARIGNAGSVFLGPYAPVAAGDYATGSNHVLPTGRRARAWAALSLDDFGRWVQVQQLTAEGLAQLRATVSTLARWEGFEAHARAAEVRFEEER
ncbi:MAG: histidinol dehydrogenase [Gemmatimonadales bacterium]|jgi:histidinol dehydrogenase